MISLRRKGSDPIPVPERGNLYLGTSVVYLGRRPAAYIVARDSRGNRLTVTQPNSATFLSPVLLFPQSQPLRDKTYPLDTFATPGAHRRATSSAPAATRALRQRLQTTRAISGMSKPPTPSAC